MPAPVPGEPDFDGFVALLRARAPALPPRLRQVADHALAHPEDMALSTASELAARAGVQPSTLVRFAQALDYSGFSELQQVFRARLRRAVPDHRARLAALRGPGGAGVLLEGFIQAGEASLSRLRETAPQAEIERATRLLAAADSIVLVGARRMFPVVSYLAYAFGRLGLRAVLADNVAGLGAEQAALARPGDAMIAVSCAPYTASTVEAAAAAHAAGVPVIALTDSALSPLADACSVRLDVVEADHGAFRSMAATFALAMTLAVGAAEAKAQVKAKSARRSKTGSRLHG